MNEIISCFFVLGHKEQDQLFAIHEQGTKIIVGELGCKVPATKHIGHLIFRDHIYLNAAKTVREYQADGFELIATVCIRGNNYLDALEMFRAVRRIDNRQAIRNYLSHADGSHLLELLLNMDPKDKLSKSLQEMAERVVKTLEKKQAAHITLRGENHAG